MSRAAGWVAALCLVPGLARADDPFLARPCNAEPCAERCYRPRAGSTVGYCSVACASDAACPAGWSCTPEKLCARGPRFGADVSAAFRARFPGARAELALRHYRAEKDPYRAELLAQIFLVSGLVAIPVGRAWETHFLEDVLFFVRLFPDAFLGTRYARLERKPIAEDAGRTVPERNAIEIHDANFGIHGTFLHELGHVLDDLRTGTFDAEEPWRKLHGWSRDPQSPTGWRKEGADCTNGYGSAYGVPGQELADEQWNYIRYGCSFRKCSAAYYAYLKERVYGGWCFCKEDPSCKNANPF